MIETAIHNASVADQIAAALPGAYTKVGDSSFEDGAFPQDGNLYVGAYGDSLIVGHMDLATSCFGGDVPPAIRVLGDLLPGASFLAIQLHSVVNLYGYALFKNNEIVRARAGSADDGVFLNVGEPLPEELRLFAKAVTNADGELVWPIEFNGSIENLDHSSMGEEFVFEISRPFFGERLDGFDLGVLPMSEYKVRPHPNWQRLFGKKP